MATARPSLVVDTNVLISAGIRVEGFSYRIVDAVLSGAADAFHCDATEAEALDVMTRARFKRYGFPPVWVQAYFRRSHRVPTPSADLMETLPDVADTVFLALAFQQRAILVTGNIADFPVSLRATVEVLTPRELVERFPEVFTSGDVGTADLAIIPDEEVSPTRDGAPAPAALPQPRLEDPLSPCLPPYCSKDGRRRCSRHPRSR